MAIFWIGLALLLNVERNKALENAIQRGTSLVLLFQENTIRLFKGVDQTLLMLRLAYEENPQHFDLRRWIDRTSFLGELTIQATLIGPDGYMRATTTDYSGPPLDLRDREHFQSHLKATTDELHISRPVMGRVSGKQTLQLTRRLRQADGSFGGVIVASVDPSFIERFHRSVNLGPEDGITLRGLDGFTRASHGVAVGNDERLPCRNLWRMRCHWRPKELLGRQHRGRPHKADLLSRRNRLSPGHHARHGLGARSSRATSIIR